MSLLLLAAAVVFGPGCGSESLGPAGLGGHAAGGGLGSGGNREGSGTGGAGEASGNTGASAANGTTGAGAASGTTGAGAANGTTGAGATSGTTGAGAANGSTDGGTSGLNGPCKTFSECQPGTTCAPPGFPGFCGICFTPAETCSSDTDCTGVDAGADASTPRPAICDPDPTNCTCDGAKTCQAGCLSNSDCATGLSCGSDHHCAPTGCTPVSDACPVDLTCGSDGHCARKSCSSDSDCSSACVLGACYGTSGYCAGDVA